MLVSGRSNMLRSLQLIGSCTLNTSHHHCLPSSDVVYSLWKPHIHLLTVARGRFWLPLGILRCSLLNCGLLIHITHIHNILFNRENTKCKLTALMDAEAFLGHANIYSMSTSSHEESHWTKLGQHIIASRMFTKDAFDILSWNNVLWSLNSQLIKMCILERPSQSPVVKLTKMTWRHHIE